MRKALETLPWVEHSSIQTDVPRREVRFNLKEKDKFNEDEVKTALGKQGKRFAELTVKSAPGKETGK